MTWEQTIPTDTPAMLIKNVKNAKSLTVLKMIALVNINYVRVKIYKTIFVACGTVDNPNGIIY